MTGTRDGNTLAIPEQEVELQHDIGIIENATVSATGAIYGDSMSGEGTIDTYFNGDTDNVYPCTFIMTGTRR